MTKMLAVFDEPNTTKRTIALDQQIFGYNNINYGCKNQPEKTMTTNPTNFAPEYRHVSDMEGKWAGGKIIFLKYPGPRTRPTRIHAGRMNLEAEHGKRYEPADLDH